MRFELLGRPSFPWLRLLVGSDVPRTQQLCLIVDGLVSLAAQEIVVTSATSLADQEIVSTAATRTARAQQNDATILGWDPLLRP